MSENSFYGMSVAVLSYTGLGDTAVGFRLAWIFHQAGARVSLFSSIFMPTREYFPWLEILSCEKKDIPSLYTQFDLVFIDVAWFIKHFSSSPLLFDDLLKYDNVACISNKYNNFPDFGDRTICVRGKRYFGADRPFCLDSKAGLSIVQWIDRYAHEVFGLDCPKPLCVKASGTTILNKTRVAIFPVSGTSRKDYFLCGFIWLAKRLNKDGWTADFVCLPREHEKIQKIAKGIDVHSFPDIKALMDYLSACAAVISNDSGGGHLGSLMGIKTITIARRERKNFAWRPGFFENHSLAPLIKIKLLGRYIWRPFIPVWRIPAILGKPENLRPEILP